MKTLFTFIFLILIVGCKTIEKKSIQKHSCKNKFYFPLQFPESDSMVNGMLDKYRNEWYSKLLCSLKEPILYNLEDKNLEVYRFSFIGPWDTGMVTYRIEKKDSTFLFTTTSKYEKKTKFEDTQLIKIEDFRELENEIDTLKFWEMNSHGDFGKDGEEWILESYKKGRYHFVDRWSPEDTLFIQTCKLIQNLCEKRN